ncbi:uncharacterized protein TEOVI_000033100 [Trypanosoma equiperdum]|uniref:Uncharacterized protein n=2 Tax=Trypanozoon TaxID=39700 RepID=Q38EL1_TRYB2|nr:hypothetical protein, unlikely [Trypanosoma brucei brucei TREU927]EAN76759.1 hypothetical protein, unlikely [Trypanosoma brucei brucei TREU927]SCU66703.1 hypothetical protein, conserved [Trypanosoma equiperdum]
MAIGAVTSYSRRRGSLAGCSLLLSPIRKFKYRSLPSTFASLPAFAFKSHQLLAHIFPCSRSLYSRKYYLPTPDTNCGSSPLLSLISSFAVLRKYTKTTHRPLLSSYYTLELPRLKISCLQ